jgi:hypothetical protein
MASSVREHFVDVSAHFAEVGLATLREIDADSRRAQAANLVGAEDVHVDWKPTTLTPRKRALSALSLSDLGRFAWSKVSSADLHVVERAFD